MKEQDWYATLGVPVTASEKEIRAAFRRLARRYHPDVNPGDPRAAELFKRVKAAYEILADPQERRRYDERRARRMRVPSTPRPSTLRRARREPVRFGRGRLRVGLLGLRISVNI